jgi:hypothetical protein
MSNTIQIKRSSTASSVPTAGQLAQGELAVNLSDKAVYTKDNTNAIVKLNAPSIDDKNTGATKHVTIDASGNVGIGTSSPSVPLQVAGTIRSTGTDANAGVQATTGSATLAVISNARTWSIQSSNGDSALRFRDETSGSERARIDSSGNLLVGTNTLGNAGWSIYGATSPGGAITKTNITSTFTHLEIKNGNNTVGSIQSSGSSTSYNTSSDYRLKHDIQPMTGALAKVAALKPVTYKWNADGSDGEGFIAHELQEVVPECVTGAKDATQIQKVEVSPAIPATYDEDGKELTPAVEAVYEDREVPVYQGIDTSFLVATLAAAIQEQQAIINDLKTRIEALEGTPEA